MYPDAVNTSITSVRADENIRKVARGFHSEYAASSKTLSLRILVRRMPGTAKYVTILVL